MFNLTPVEVGILVVLGAALVYVAYHLHTTKTTVVAAVNEAVAAVKAHVEPGNTTGAPLPTGNAGRDFKFDPDLGKASAFPVGSDMHDLTKMKSVAPVPTPEHAIVASLIPSKPVETESDAAFEKARVEAVASILKAQADGAVAKAASQVILEHARIDAQAAIDKADATQRAAKASADGDVAKAQAEGARATAQARIDSDLASSKRQAGH